MFSKIKRAFKKEPSKEELDEKIAELNMEKEDFKAMVTAALLILMPAVIIVALIFYAIIYFIFM